MSKTKIAKELTRVREQLASLKRREADLLKELKMAEDAEKQTLLEKHHISAEELMEMIKAKQAEDRRLLSLKRQEDEKNEERSL